jgi:hypothetical protein
MESLVMTVLPEYMLMRDPIYRCVSRHLKGGMVTLYRVTMKPFAAQGHATAKPAWTGRL